MDKFALLRTVTSWGVLKMDRDKIKTIQASWNNLMGTEEAMVARFYRRFFSTYPEYRQLFVQDMATQRAKFLSMLNLIINGLDQIELLSETLEELGNKHNQLGIKLHDYEIVSQVLIDAIDDVSDRSLSTEERECWHEAYMFIANIMMNANSTVTSCENIT